MLLDPYVELAVDVADCDVVTALVVPGSVTRTMVRLVSCVVDVTVVS